MSKGSTNSSQTSDQTSTPNNLAQIQQGQGQDSALLNATGSNGANLVNTGLNLVNNGATAGNTAAAGGLNAATNLVNGGTANAANGYLTPFANGTMAAQNNPNFQNVINQFANATQASVDGGAAAAGRYGSGADANAYNGAVANEAGQLAYTNFAQQQQNQLAAANQLSANNTNATQQSIAALNAIPGLSSAGTSAGQAAITAGQAPTTNYALNTAMLGAGGGTVNGTQNSTTSQSGLNLSGGVGPLIASLFGG